MSNQPTYEELEEQCGRLRKLADRAPLLEAVLDSTSTPIFSLDREYRYQFFNQAHARTMEGIYGHEIRVGRCLLEYQPEVDRNAAKSNLDRALKGESVVASAFSGDEALDRRYFEIVHNPVRGRSGIVVGVSVIALDITERKRLEDRNAELVESLQRSLEEIKTLRGILPLCSFCKKIRDDKGYWEQVDIYIHKHTEADISHGICPACMKIHYPEAYEARKRRMEGT